MEKFFMNFLKIYLKLLIKRVNLQLKMNNSINF